MENTQLDSALSRLRGFTARKATPIALKVKIDNQEKSFVIDPATGKVSKPPAAYGWAKGFDYKELKRFFVVKNYKVEEVMGEIAPVLV
jgi:hypothetical protein